jgi:hypothetical protein
LFSSAAVRRVSVEDAVTKDGNGYISFQRFLRQVIQYSPTFSELLSSEERASWVDSKSDDWFDLLQAYMYGDCVCWNIDLSFEDEDGDHVTFSSDRDLGLAIEETLARHTNDGINGIHLAKKRQLFRCMASVQPNPEIMAQKANSDKQQKEKSQAVDSELRTSKEQELLVKNLHPIWEQLNKHTAQIQQVWSMATWQGQQQSQIQQQLFQLQAPSRAYNHQQQQMQTQASQRGSYPIVTTVAALAVNAYDVLTSNRDTTQQSQAPMHVSAAPVPQPQPAPLKLQLPSTVPAEVLAAIKYREHAEKGCNANVFVAGTIPPHQASSLTGVNNGNSGWHTGGKRANDTDLQRSTASETILPKRRHYAKSHGPPSRGEAPGSQEEQYAIAAQSLYVHQEKYMHLVKCSPEDGLSHWSLVPSNFKIFSSRLKGSMNVNTTLEMFKRWMCPDEEHHVAPLRFLQSHHLRHVQPSVSSEDSTTGDECAPAARLLADPPRISKRTLVRQFQVVCYLMKLLEIFVVQTCCEDAAERGQDGTSGVAAWKEDPTPEEVTQWFDRIHIQLFALIEPMSITSSNVDIPLAGPQTYENHKEIQALTQKSWAGVGKLVNEGLTMSGIPLWRNDVNTGYKAAMKHQKDVLGTKDDVPFAAQTAVVLEPFVFVLKPPPSGQDSEQIVNSGDEEAWI